MPSQRGPLSHSKKPRRLPHSSINKTPSTPTTSKRFSLMFSVTVASSRIRPIPNTSS